MQKERAIGKLAGWQKKQRFINRRVATSRWVIAGVGARVVGDDRNWK